MAATTNRGLICPIFNTSSKIAKFNKKSSKNTAGNPYGIYEDLDLHHGL